MKKRFVILFVCALFNSLSACSMLSPVKLGEVQRYTLGMHNESRLTEKSSDKTVLVLRTKAAAGYDSQNILYAKQPFQLQSFQQNEWVAPPAQLISSLIERSLEKSHAFKAVVTTGYSGADTDFTVDSTLQRLDQDFTGTHNVVHLEISVQVIDNAAHKIVGSQLFSTTVPTTSADPYGGVLAANAATKKLMKDVTDFVIKNLGSSDTQLVPRY